ncbi:hypothetical protein EBN03_22750 [Nocardia stercoris]|uniref:RNA polymerase sigma-70 region 4 domain-containing protein n=1 Tax=Nocardia stercoris TaxID=2483361 RepID=A0A3M2KZW0_9NOCA|nr:hypothetical protein EBN03_22750 [Nocardia stercoris]
MGAEQLDDVAAVLSFALEEIDEALAVMVADQAEDRPRDGALLTARLGLDGERPSTLTLLGAQYELSRDRVRQIYTRAAGQVYRRVRATAHPDTAVFAARYPVGWSDERLVRLLLAEIYATDCDLAAQDLAYLKLRLAGHPLQDAKRLAGFVFQRIAGWQQRGRNHPAGPESGAGALLPLLRRAEWARHGTPEPLPDNPIHTVDTADEARGSMAATKPGRTVTFDTALEARLLRLLDESEQVRTFTERPIAVEYTVDDEPRLHHPTVAAHLTDGRTVLVDVVPLGRLACYPNLVRLAATGARARELGWGRLVFTGSAIGEPDLRELPVPASSEHPLRNRLARGPLLWPEFRALTAETGLEPTQFNALVLRHGWRWERGPFRLARG